MVPGHKKQIRGGLGADQKEDTVIHIHRHSLKNAASKHLFKSQ